MRESKLLKKIRAGECARVCATGHYLPFFVRYAAHFKFDAIWFDLEPDSTGIWRTERPVS